MHVYNVTWLLIQDLVPDYQNLEVVLSFFLAGCECWLLLLDYSCRDGLVKRKTVCKIWERVGFGSQLLFINKETTISYS